MSITDRRERDREKIKQLILTAAADIISQEGLEKLSVRKIAARIDYSPAIIYHYFRDKDDILNQTITAQYQKIVRNLSATAAAAVKPEDKLRETARSYIETALSMPDHYLSSVLSRSSEMLEYTACMFPGAASQKPALGILFACLKELPVNRDRTDGEIEMTAQLIVAAVMGLVIKLIVEKELSSPQKSRLIDYFVEHTVLKIAGGA